MESEKNQNLKLDIGVADPEDLNDQDIAALAESLVSTTFDLLNVRAEKARMKIKDVMHKIRDRAQGTLPFVSGWSEKIADKVYPGHTHKGFIDGYQGAIRKMLAAGELVVAKAEDKVVGCIAFRKWADFEGKEVYETTKGTILPEFRGHKYYTQLKAATMDVLAEKHPTSPVITVSKNPAIIAHMKKHFPTTQEIPLKSDHPLSKKMEADIGEPEFSKMVEKKNVILWYEPPVPVEAAAEPSTPPEPSEATPSS